MPREKPRIIGMGTLVALIAAAAILAYNYHDTKSREAAIKHEQLNMFSGKFELPAGPGIDSIIAKSAELSLSKQQEEKLRELDKQWSEASTSIKQKLRDESRNAQERLNAAGNGKTTIDELRGIAEPLSQATADYRRLSDEFANRARGLLTPGQRDKIEPAIRERIDSK